MLRPRRALGSAGVAGLAALALAGCSQTGSSSSASSSAVTVTGHKLLVYISAPSSLRNDPVAQDVVDAEQLAFRAHEREVKDYDLSVITLHSTPSNNARVAIIDERAIAYLGEIAPGTSDQTVGITNALDLLQVSPTDNALELTQRTPAVSDAPKTYFQSWGTYGRTYARVVPSAAAEAKAEVAEMKSLGIGKLYVRSDGSDYGKAISGAVSSDARAAGITLATSLSSADGAFDGAQSPTAAARFFNQAATAVPNVKLFGPSSLNSGVFASAISSTARNVYVSIPGYLPKSLSVEGRGFVAGFKAAYGHAPNVAAIFGYEAMSAVLRVLQKEGRGANNRTTVVNGFLGQRKVRSVLGTYSIDAAGNTSLDAFVFARMRGGRLVPFAAVPRS